MAVNTKRVMEELLRELKEEIHEKLTDIGSEAVAYAVEHGNYQDHTGRLRASNKCDVEDTRLHLYNDAPYGTYVEAKGYDVISGAIVHTEIRVKQEFNSAITNRK